MEIVNSKSAVLSNYEVEKYLEGTPCRYQNPEVIQNFLTILPQKGFKFTKAEKLQLVNLRPVTPVEIQLIVEDSEERITEDQIDELISLIKEHLPDGSNDIYPNGT
ncbi:DNA-directed RNA polymerase III subunit RPC9 [Armadillidium nasatum]|uniref:DNA-directed RNA polymerase III subunit RPC9 n=1 Tax=Armadillidium nasatum TaxID=96803 RepID=A0A5N5SRE9_9CRUS|nr:DNA-directed RNA polymerase III subunit RPC9 [Armadillidium nasatum]